MGETGNTWIRFYSKVCYHHAEEVLMRRIGAKKQEKIYQKSVQGVQETSPSCREKDILIGSTIPDILPAVVADACRIKQVLINLIDNALKYNEGDSTVIIKTQIMDNKLMILVEDHGIGIPEGETPAIFDDYYRASNHGIEEGQGLSLGICKRIIESHGGHIQVQSVEGVGSTFGFTIPLAHV